MRLRQIALVAGNLAAATADIEAVLGLGVAFADPGVAAFGLRNAVWPVGTTFLEVVSPDAPGTTAARLLEKRHGDGGYMVIFQVADIAAARTRLARSGVRTVWDVDRPDPDGRGGVSASHLHPRDIGGAIVSVDQMTPAPGGDPQRWDWGGPDWRARPPSDLSLAIVGCELQADDPEAMSARWAEALGLPRERDAGVWRLRPESGEVRFVAVRDGRGEGLGGFDLTVRDPAEVRRRAAERGCLDSEGGVVLCGARVRLEPPP